MGIHRRISKVSREKDKFLKRFNNPEESGISIGGTEEEIDKFKENMEEFKEKSGRRIRQKIEI